MTIHQKSTKVMVWDGDHRKGRIMVDGEVIMAQRITISNKLKMLPRVIMLGDLLEVVEGGVEAWEEVAGGAGLKVKVVQEEEPEAAGHKAKMVWEEVAEATEAAGHKVKMVWEEVAEVAGHKMKAMREEVAGVVGHKAKVMEQVEGEEEAEANGMVLIIWGEVDEEAGLRSKGTVQMTMLGAVMGGIEILRQEKLQQQMPMIGGH